MSGFDPSQFSSSDTPGLEQNPIPSSLNDLKDPTGLSGELKEIFSKGQQVLRENPVLNGDVQRLESRVIEMVEYPGNVALFGTTKKTLDREDLKRVHSVEAYEFKRNGPEVEILKISVQSLKDNSNAEEYVRRIEEDFSFNNEKANDKVSSSMQGVEIRRNLDVSFFDQSRIYRERANRKAHETLEDITFSFEDPEERKVCAVVIKRALGGVFLSVVDFRNPDRARMFVTERPVLLEGIDEKKFEDLKQKLSTHVNGMKKDFD